MGLIKDYEEIRSKLLPHLVDYLREKGIDPTGAFRCINPNHEDRNPSMGLVPASNDTYTHCFSCGASHSVIDAYAILEGTPIEGPGWLMSTFLPLCRKYGIQVDLSELSEEDKEKYAVFNAYAQAAKILRSAEPSAKVYDEIMNRGWNLMSVREIFGLGSIDFNSFTSQMYALGYSKEFLVSTDLYNEKIFNENNLIIPIKDENGMYCGFVARNLNFKKGSRSPKFINTSNKCPVYSKGDILFNFNRAKSFIPPLYIVESYMDTITMVQKGVENVVGIGSTALTDEHIELIRKHEINNIILALDFDKAGVDSTSKYVEQLSGRPGLSLSILTLPEGFHDDEVIDPEDYIKKYGIDSFKTLPAIGAFEWRLLNQDYKAQPYDLAIKTIPIIANESNTIEREKQCRILSKHTGIDLSIIKDELDRICKIESSRKASLRDDLIRKVMKDLQKYPAAAHNILSAGVSKLEDIDLITSASLYSKDEYVTFLETKKLTDESTTNIQASSGFKRFDIKTSSQWAAPGTLIAIGGRSNSGKTAFLINLAYNIATMNDNAVVLFHSIDDSRFIMVPKFIALDSKVKINHIITPEFSKQYYSHIDLMKVRDESYRRMMRLAQEDRLIVKDAEIGASLESVETWVKKYRKEYPDKQIIYFLDNFHLLSDMANITEERVRNKERSKLIKKIVTKYGITMFMTVEYTKVPPGHRPHNFDILETGQIEYDCNAIYHVYNPYSDVGQSGCDMSKHTWQEYDELIHELTHKPMVELITGKSKLSAYKGSYTFKFAPDTCSFKELESESAGESW